MSEELKACPFCGCEAVITEHSRRIYDDTVYYDVTCAKCECELSTIITEYKAAETWNTRPLEDSLRDELEEAKAAILVLKHEIENLKARIENTE